MRIQQESLRKSTNCRGSRVLCIFAALAVMTLTAAHATAQEPVSPLHWGIDNAGGPYTLHQHPKATQLFHDFGWDTFVAHYDPQSTTQGYINLVRAVNTWAASAGVEVILNLENANWFTSFVDANGFDWYNRPDGRHYYMFPPAILQELGNNSNILGVMYDEAEHAQNWNNSATINKPYMYNYPSGDTLDVAADRFTTAAQGIAAVYEAQGLKLFTEHVLPIQYHTYARAGYNPAPKILKESWCPLVLASAMGAAIEYGRDFWATPDLWHQNDYPGHTTDEYRSALLLAYHLGVEGIYTENLAYTGAPTTSPEHGSLVSMTLTDYTVTSYGDVAIDFYKNYVPSHPRRYSFDQVKPRVVIVRQEDTSWGQTPESFFGEQLFGNPAWKRSATTDAWFGLWNLLSGGRIPASGLTWWAYTSMPYSVFCPLDGVVVFDQYAQKAHMQGAEVIFLTGLGVSPATLQAVQELVSAGATCVALPHLVQPGVLQQTGNAGVLADGNGKWVVTEDFLAPFVQPHVASAIPTGDYVRYRFGNDLVTVAPVNGDPNKLTAAVETDTDNDGQFDNVDLDDDNNGVPDVEEGIIDRDGDGLGDAVDIDNDGDGIGDVTEGNADTDHDGIINYNDLDSDDDGFSDSSETQHGTDPYDATDLPAMPLPWGLGLCALLIVGTGALLRTRRHA